jgi:hypothetical protein
MRDRSTQELRMSFLPDRQIRVGAATSVHARTEG